MRLEAPFHVIVDGAKTATTSDFTEAAVAADVLHKQGDDTRRTLVYATLRNDAREEITTFPAPCVVAIFHPKMRAEEAPATEERK